MMFVTCGRGENQSRSPTDQATPSSDPSPPSSSLSSLPSPSRAPLVHTSQTSSTPSCLPNTPFIQFLPFSLLPALQHLLQIIIQSLHVFPSSSPPLIYYPSVFLLLDTEL